MSRCFTFDEWFRICNELEDMYWSCLKSCLEETKGKTSECSDKCEKEVVRYGMEKYSLAEIQALLCMHLSGPA